MERSRTQESDHGQALARLRGMIDKAKVAMLATLDPAQELIGDTELVAGLLGDPVAGGEHIERLQGRTNPQLRMAAAGDQLLGLGEEFDLADAAAPDLDVVALDGDLAVAAIDLHLPLHVVDVGQRLEVEMLAPDEGGQIGQHRLARGDVTGTDACLDHRGAFPGAALAFVVVQRRLCRHRDLRRGRSRRSTRNT